MLKEMVKAKTGYISKEQWHKALEAAKSRKTEYQHQHKTFFERM